MQASRHTETQTHAYTPHTHSGHTHRHNLLSVGGLALIYATDEHSLFSPQCLVDVLAQDSAQQTRPQSPAMWATRNAVVILAVVVFFTAERRPVRPQGWFWSTSDNAWVWWWDDLLWTWDDQMRLWRTAGMCPWRGIDPWSEHRRDEKLKAAQAVALLPLPGPAQATIMSYVP